jgi:hypothetical protein
VAGALGKRTQPLLHASLQSFNLSIFNLSTINLDIFILDIVILDTVLNHLAVSKQ